MVVYGHIGVFLHALKSSHFLCTFNGENGSKYIDQMNLRIVVGDQKPKSITKQ